MKNYIQAGENLTLPAPYNVSSGEGALVGAIFGVASVDALSGADVALVTEGVFTLPKEETDVIGVGDAVYWDDAAKNVTTTATDNTKIGAAVSAAGNPSSSVIVRLNGSF